MISIRAVKPADEAFIYDNWMKVLETESRFARSIIHRVFQRHQHALIERILNRHTTRIVVACDPDNEDTIQGFLVYEDLNSETVVHWVHTKPSLRGFGVASFLLATLGTQTWFYTSETEKAEPILRRWRENTGILKRTCQWCWNPLTVVQTTPLTLWGCRCSRKISRPDATIPAPCPEATYNPYLI